MPLSSRFKSLIHYAALAILVVIFISFFYFRLYDYLTLDTLKYYQAEIQIWTTTHYYLAISLYIILFTSLIACAIPCATFLTLVGGFLFDTMAIVYAEFSITMGGMILYLAVRSAIGTKLAARKTGWIKKIETGFKQDAFSYLLTLRLLPIMPCWVSNIGAGIFNLPIKTFVSATALGILPSTIIYVYAGRSLDQILVEKAPIFDILFTPSILFPLIGLAVLSLSPVIYKWIKKPDQNS
jgi:uncharacterized membrane protein YdjX (TVP38/TMEM64 family)